MGFEITASWLIGAIPFKSNIISDILNYFFSRRPLAPAPAHGRPSPLFARTYSGRISGCHLCLRRRSWLFRRDRNSSVDIWRTSQFLEESSVQKRSCCPTGKKRTHSFGSSGHNAGLWRVPRFERIVCGIVGVSLWFVFNYRN